METVHLLTAGLNLKLRARLQGCLGHVQVEVVTSKEQLFFKLGFLHQPVRRTADQLGIRSAALIAARPQPDMVGEQQRDPAWRATEMARLQALIANPVTHREHLLKSSMISGLARAAATV